MTGDNRLARFRGWLNAMPRLGRAGACVLALLLLWPAASYAGTVTTVTSVTLPSTITASTVLGPQTVKISTTNTYTTSSLIGLELDVSGALFVPSGNFSAFNLTCSVITPLVNKVIYEQCTPAANTFLIAVSYTNATGLLSGTPITLSGQIYNGNNPTQTFETLPSSTVVEAPVSYTLTTSTTGSGSGTVTASPLASTFVSGASVTLTATPASGSTFAGWSGGGCTGTDRTCTVSMSSNQAVTATFNTAGYTLTTTTTGTGTGAVSTSPSAASYASGTVVTLTASAGAGSTFTGWSGGGCGGTATTCQVTMNSNQTVTATFTRSSAYILTLTYGGSGSGLVVASPAAASYNPGTVVTLTASTITSSTFAGWSGACSGTQTTCTVTMNSNQTVTATFNAQSAASGTLRQAAVFSSASPSSQSFLRFYNAGTTAGTVTVTLSDYITGLSLGQWTSPSIAPGTAPQYPISTVEAGLSSPGSKPAFYSVTMQSQFIGTFQHVLFKPSDGTLTNLSTCDSGITAIPSRVVNVHSSLLGNAGYPSSIVVYNTGTAATSTSLTVTDAATGRSLGVYATSPIPANGEQIFGVSTIEAALNITPSSSAPHYVVATPATFTGYLQHLVNNSAVGVTTDMSTVCSFPTSTTTTTPPVAVNPSGS